MSEIEMERIQPPLVAAENLEYPQFNEGAEHIKDADFERDLRIGLIRKVLGIVGC